MTEPKISARDVNVYYGEKRAIDNVSIDIDAGVVTAFIGPSGCGKSTFLRTLNRMNDTIAGARVEGSIKLDGEERIRGLGLTVGLPLVVGARGEVDVVEHHGRQLVAGGRDADDAGAVGGLQRGGEARDQREVAEMVGGELRFPVGPDTRFGIGHDGGVVDEDVQRLARGDIAVGECLDGLEIGKVQLGEGVVITREGVKFNDDGESNFRSFVDGYNAGVEQYFKLAGN